MSGDAGSAGSRPRLLLVAHGTASEAGQRVIADLLDAVGARMPDVDLALAWVDVISPEPSEILADGAPTVLVPAFLGHGFHVSHDIPEAVAAAPGRVAVTPHLGAADEVVEAVADRLAGVGVTRGGADAIVLAGAGSRSAESITETSLVADGLADRLDIPVIPGFVTMAEPTVADAIESVSAHDADRGRDANIAVATFLLAEGYFAGRIAQAAPGIVSPPIGAHPAIVDLIVRHYRRAAETL